MIKFKYITQKILDNNKNGIYYNIRFSAKLIICRFEQIIGIAKQNREVLV